MGTVAPRIAVQLLIAALLAVVLIVLLQAATPSSPAGQRLGIGSSESHTDLGIRFHQNWGYW